MFITVYSIRLVKRLKQFIAIYKNGKYTYEFNIITNTI